MELEVTCDTLGPTFVRGTRLGIDPRRAPLKGDVVIVTTTEGYRLVRYEGTTGDKLRICPPNAPADAVVQELPGARIVGVYVYLRPARRRRR